MSEDLIDNSSVNPTTESVKDYLENIISLMPGHIFWKDLNCRFLGCNDLQAKMAGLSSRHEIVGKSALDIISKNQPEANRVAQAEAIDNVDRKIMRTGVSLVVEEPLILDDGTEKIFLSQKMALRDNKKNIIGLLGIAIDITERKKMEESLRHAKEAAEIANQAKTEFLANMRHDIRTPLSGIVGFSEILKSESKEPRIKEFADNLIASSNALTEFMNEVLEAITVSSGEVPRFKKKFNLSATVKRVIDLYTAKAEEKSLKLTLNMGNDIPNFVTGDKIRFHRIVLELVGNALNFTDEGHVTVDVELAKRDNRNLVIEVRVSDSGMGIPKDKQQEIYVQFKRLTPSWQGIYKGAGLGLYIVKQFIDELEGEIYVESEPHKGTCFTCLIPLQESLLDDARGIDNDEDLQIEKPYMTPLKHQPSLIAEPDTDSNASIRVLVVEDNPIAQKVAKTILSGFSCRVEVASSGEEALSQCENNIYDIIFMDIGLGKGMDGYDVTHHIRSNHEKMQNTPIVALTAHGADENKQRCIKAGMNAVLTKPLTEAVAKDVLDVFVKQKKKADVPPVVVKPARRDLPDTDEEMFELEQFALLDEEQGLKSSGDKEMLSELLTMMANTQIPEELESMKSAYEIQNYPLVEQLAHKMKGGAVYVGTTRMKYACQYLERYWKTGERELFDKLYHQAIKTIEDTQTSIEKWLQTNHHEP